ncbi:MAG: DUF3857 domain-containing protein [Bacteroidia bacterium]
MKPNLSIFRLYLICSMAFFAFCNSAEAAEPLYKSYKWEEKPSPSKLNAKELTEAVVIIFDKHIIEYTYNSEGELQKYYIRHRRMRANTSEHLDYLNKIKIGLGNVVEFITLKTRIITPAGKVSEINQSVAKDIDNEEEGRFKILAIEGLEPGSEVEYYYIEKHNVTYFDANYLQYGLPSKEVSVELRSPHNLKFETKSYNGLAKAKDTVVDEVRISSVVAKDVPALNEEKYAFYDANLLRLEYKLAYNANRENTRILTWTDAGQRYFEMLHKIEKEDKKAIQKLFKSIKTSPGNNKENVRAIESYLKTNFSVLPVFSKSGENCRSVISSHMGSKLAITQLYVQLLGEMKIRYEIVLTCDRTSRAFDPEFDTWNYLENMLLYLPDEDLYLSPTNEFCRLGYISSDYLDNDALFIEPVTLGNLTTGLAKVKHITFPGHEINFDKLDVEVTFKEGMDESTLNLKHSMGGYSALDLRAAYFFLPEDKRKDLATELLKMGAEDGEVKTVKVSNFDINTPDMDKPFLIEGNLTMDDLLEQANDKYLIKVGTLIGPQAEMYQEKTRQTPVQLTYPHGYHRKLKINIPKGYTVSGLEALKMNHVYGSPSQADLRFVSDYTLKDNVLEIEIFESYSKTLYPLTVFEQYREVVNAAANFNKVVLVLKKA